MQSRASFILTQEPDDWRVQSGTLAALRRPIERNPGVLKRWDGDGRVRHRNPVKALQLQLLAVALNLRR